MASVPNRVYPMAEFPVINCTTLNYVNEYLIGFKAQGAIAQYQPVVFATLNTDPTSTSVYVSGATADLQSGIIGAATAAAVDDASVTVISRGVITAYQSGSTAITLGGMVGYAFSGSVVNRVKAATGIGTILGIAVTTGASVNGSSNTIYVYPH